MNNREYSVSELNKLVKLTLETNSNFKNFYLKGEISNITYYKSGHLYFTLKDKKASIKCAAFNYRFKNVPVDLEAGENVRILGSVTLYEANGQYQVIVDEIEKENKLGSLYVELEKLKKELDKKGYFDKSIKKRLPIIPYNIGVVTSGTGAAVRDIINTTHKRFENLNIYVYPAKVQGKNAELEIKKGIETLNRLDYIDVIIIGRGGGSIEDLWAFNKREVAEAIYNSEKPIISAVGHEIDFLLSDLVADSRAATPTQAAEILVPEKESLLGELNIREVRVANNLKKLLELKKIEFEQRKENYFIKNYKNYIVDKNNILIGKEEKLNNSLKKMLEIKKSKFEISKSKIDMLNPYSILNRGYSITKLNGKIIKSVEKIRESDELLTILSDGEINSVVK
ncbi:exodeoxyribonuclease VII large subunit [Haliovirga abyssi]|uniref:Exodeoxyribonuclease 7 large subunit n=1 Tax=Haliovirga abyssi TaxID=2996794 RepID=A0AAU9DA87_9FUSO|nr:exodeoxyribonuclease VII large subunit [Haliovirga abyssi]BDU50511.1 exodeoxyribonuclease 7 large subunit [Haliovirga abyssi]